MRSKSGLLSSPISRNGLMGVRRISNNSQTPLFLVMNFAEKSIFVGFSKKSKIFVDFWQNH